MGKTFTLIISLLGGIIFSAEYDVGDLIDMEDQIESFSVCNGEYYYDEFSLADLNGELNGGHYFISMIDISATWCEPCQLYAQGPMSTVTDEWETHPNVTVITSLSDLNQPYSCSQWGSLGTSENNPLIFHDPSYKLMGWFGCCGASEGWPSTAYLNENMEVYFKGNYMGAYEINYVIEQMLESCGEDCVSPPPMALFAYEMDGLTVTFIDLSVSETSEVINWNWDFGDGSTSQEQFPIHTYSTSGTYYVTLDVTDQYGADGIQYWEYLNLEGESECGSDGGDVTGDGNVNILDIVQVANYILGVSTPQFSCAADFTQDGQVNILDIVQIANFILDN